MPSILDEFLEWEIAGVTPGDDWRIVIPVEGFAPQPGDAARMQLRERPEAPAVRLELSTANGRIQLAPGEIVLAVASAGTAAVPPLTYAWDLELTRDGVVTTIMGGSFAVRRDVTR